MQRRLNIPPSPSSAHAGSFLSPSKLLRPEGTEPRKEVSPPCVAQGSVTFKGWLPQPLDSSSLPPPPLLVSPAPPLLRDQCLSLGGWLFPPSKPLVSLLPPPAISHCLATYLAHLRGPGSGPAHYVTLSNLHNLVGGTPGNLLDQEAGARGRHLTNVNELT